MDLRKGERPCWDDQRGSWTYLDIVGQLRGHQLVELLLAQGAGRAVLPGVRLELGDQGADGGFHGDFEGTKKEEKEMKWKVGKQPLEERGCGGLTCRVMLCRVSLRSERTVYIYACYIFDRGGKKLGSAETTQPALVFFFFFSPMRTQTLDVIADWFPLAHASSNTPTHRRAKKKYISPASWCPPKDKIALMVAQTLSLVSARREIQRQQAASVTVRPLLIKRPGVLPVSALIGWYEKHDWSALGYAWQFTFEGICSTEWIFTCAAGSKWQTCFTLRATLTVIRWWDEISKNADASLAGSGASSVAYILERWHIGAAAGWFTLQFLCARFQEFSI